jgi:two-component system, chemotaxis family, protein-glutamate methylesterase/glutaminase
MKVMIVDDSLTYRLILKEVLRGLPGVEVVASASNGEDALKKLAELNGDIDLTLLHLQMPVMDGMQTMAAIHERFPEINAVVVSGFNVENAELTIHALERGAVDFIRKPDHAQAEENVEELHKQLEHIIASCRKKNPTAPTPVAPSQPPTQSASAVLLSKNPTTPKAVINPTAAVNVPKTPPPKATTIKETGKKRSACKAIDVVTIGISTGGPAALLNLIPRLPKDLGVPILIVQHMPPLFTRSLADSLNNKSAVRVHEAVEGEAVQPDTV